jgi:diguanylate cyclase (GGDEF)-like protein/PAS domain S-box-containing protein
MGSHRTLRRALCHGAAYGAAAAFAVALTRISGGFAMFWIATALIVPGLLARPPRQWWSTIFACAVASMAVTGGLGMGWRAAPVLALANCGEAIVAALIVRAAHRRYRSYASLRWLAATFLAGGLIAPAISGMPATLVMVWVTGKPLVASYGAWMLSHGLGFIAIFPTAGLLAQARVRHRSILPPPEKRKAAALSLAGVVAAGAVCFGQSSVPMLFLPILVLMYTMVLTDIVVSAVGLVLLLVMGVGSALLGIGPLQLVADAPAERYLMLQFYTACISLTAMPVALMLDRRRALFAALAESETRYRLLADFSTDIIMVTDNRGTIRYISPSIRQLGDYDPAALVGKSTDMLIATQHRDEVAQAYAGVVLHPGTTASVEFLGVTRSSGMRWFESHMRSIQREDGGVDGVCSIVRDIAQRKRREAELNAVALTDPLTSLANRRAFDMFMANAGDDEDGFVALFDLDHFKRVNDTHGHEAGDRVIKAFARAARGAVRDSDLVARIGGEEFAIHLHDTTLAQARVVCERIRFALGEEARRSAPEVGPVTASVGISRLDGPLAAVLRRADAALYQAKAAGRDQLAIAA